MNCTEDLNNNEDILTSPRLSGILPEDLAKMVFNVLYRKALIVTDEWAHWVLLASLHILENNCAPPLDIKSLCKLQGLCEREVISDLDNHSLEPSVECESCVRQKGKVQHLTKTSENGVNSEHDILVSKGTQQKRKLSDLLVNNGKVKKIESQNVNGDSENTTACCKIENNDGAIESVLNSEVKNVSKVKEISILKCSVMSQVTPKMLGVTHNKWTQMWKKKTFHKSCQTEEILKDPVKTVLDAQTQVDLAEETMHCNTVLNQKVTVDRESQTLIIHRKDFSSQYSYKTRSKLEVKNDWKLIPISGLPDLKLDRYSVTPSTSVTATEFGNNRSAQSPMDNEFSTKFFHGRPLLTSKSKISAPDIPLIAVDSYFVSDPRNINE